MSNNETIEFSTIVQEKALQIDGLPQPIKLSINVSLAALDSDFSSLTQWSRLYPSAIRIAELRHENTNYEVILKTLHENRQYTDDRYKQIKSLVNDTLREIWELYVVPLLKEHQNQIVLEEAKRRESQEAEAKKQKELDKQWIQEIETRWQQHLAQGLVHWRSEVSSSWERLEQTKQRELDSQWEKDTKKSLLARGWTKQECEWHMDKASKGQAAGVLASLCVKPPLWPSELSRHTAHASVIAKVKSDLKQVWKNELMQSTSARLEWEAEQAHIVEQQKIEQARIVEQQKIEQANRDAEDQQKQIEQQERRQIEQQQQHEQEMERKQKEKLWAEQEKLVQQEQQRKWLAKLNVAPLSLADGKIALQGLENEHEANSLPTSNLRDRAICLRGIFLKSHNIASSQSNDAAGSGAIIGGLLGLIAGPFGAIIGAGVGAAIGGSNKGISEQDQWTTLLANLDEFTNKLF